MEAIVLPWHAFPISSRLPPRNPLIAAPCVLRPVANLCDIFGQMRSTRRVRFLIEYDVTENSNESNVDSDSVEYMRSFFLEF
jgi:hypothetical protein